MELDNIDTASPLNIKYGAAKENLERNPGQIYFSYGREFKTISKSAPLLPENKLNLAGRLSQLRPSPSYKFTSYVLPTPVETKDPGFCKSGGEVPQTRQANMNLWHSSPLAHNKYEKLVAIHNQCSKRATSIQEAVNCPLHSPMAAHQNGLIQVLHQISHLVVLFCHQDILHFQGLFCALHYLYPHRLPNCLQLCHQLLCHHLK
ncbi:uncharacterized protein At2g33490-like isoform X2 [Olea europaea var. sylvestris]|uniref:uncharacterized protein At2g33490-like isoform X2 n=1 Tax=Olea europaea var. sylvestris TaxID=158386 RepID=UPI000C1D0136|nr:uncharacterized protein At2g33490-like isoform X2 [Olea europaea var. sylvestris]